MLMVVTFLHMQASVTKHTLILQVTVSTRAFALELCAAVVLLGFGSR